MFVCILSFYFKCKKYFYFNIYTLFFDTKGRNWDLNLGVLTTHSHHFTDEPGLTGSTSVSLIMHVILEKVESNPHPKLEP